MKISLYDFTPHGDNRGQLVALEEYREIPFAIRRVYYMYDTVPDAVRGRHAHRNLQQVLVCVHGSCKVLLDDGRERQTVTLSRPWQGLGIANVIWRELFDFSPDAVLMVLASAPYDENDYIRDYREFLAFLREQEGKEEAK